MSDQPLLKVNDLHKSFGDNTIHSGISFNLFEGETLALLGRSGTGKSVLLRTIIGLDKCDKGEIFFKDSKISCFSEVDYLNIRTKIAYAFQNGALFDSLTVFENIAYPLREHTNMTFAEITKSVADVLNLVELSGIQERMPSDLSGGMQKRVGLARSIIMRPTVVLYDEPTAGLDPQNSLNITKIMKKLKQSGLTSILVTHDIPAAIDVADRIIVLHGGNIIFNDGAKSFLNSKSKIIKEFIRTEGYLDDKPKRKI